MYRVLFVKEKKEAVVAEGTTILEAAIQAGLKPDAPCGGTGKCGKCLVRVSTQLFLAASQAGETGVRSIENPQAGETGDLVKACQYRVTGDVQVETLNAERQKEHVILTEGFSRQVAFDPGLQLHKIRLEKPLPGEKRSEWERMLEALAQAGGPAPEKVKPDLEVASMLHDCRREQAAWYVVHTPEEILELRREPGRRLLAAFDIGTTTVAGYLLDGSSGTVLAVESRMNPQAQYGADVIARASYAMKHGADSLSGCIRETVNEMLGVLTEQAAADRHDVFQVSIVGNTCMHHLFLGISPGALVRAPYTPVIRQRLTLPAAGYGLKIHPRGRILMLPDIAGYVGADTCGCLLTVRPDQQEEITLLVDIGTNGEMVLGSRERLVTCSTAAGPAFEGAKIECGMRGAAGAVDHVCFREGIWNWTTVGGCPAMGLCGSGLIDLVAQLLEAGLIDESGRLHSGQADPAVFVLVPPEQAGTSHGVYLTQKDVREVQLAKAAIAAGIRLLMKELSVEEEKIACVYVAGAFGSYMNPWSAGRIGMLPGKLSDKVKPVGNAAGEGAKIALINEEELRQADELAEKTDFIELASLPEFQDCFVDELEFPESGKDGSEAEC